MTAAESWPVRYFDPLPLVRRYLIRYQGLSEGYRCLPARRHEARVLLDEVHAPVESTKRIWTPDQAGVALDDPRWPARCANPACPVPGGYAFDPDDIHYVRGDRLMAETSVEYAGMEGIVLSVDDLPYGAVYRADHPDARPERFERVSGQHVDMTAREVLRLERGGVAVDWQERTSLVLSGPLVVKTPDGLWWIDRTTPDRNGTTCVLDVQVFGTLDARRPLTSVHRDGPAPAWVIRDGRLSRAQGAA